MSKKGEIAFSTIVTVIIAASILVLVLVWLIPNYSDIFSKTEDAKENAGVTDENILKIKCEPLCDSARDKISSGLSPSKTDFCKDEDCKSQYSQNCIVGGGKIQC